MPDKQQSFTMMYRSWQTLLTNKADGKSKVNRLAVVVTGMEVEKIPGIKIPSGTGEAQAKCNTQITGNSIITSTEKLTMLTFAYGVAL